MFFRKKNRSRKKNKQESIIGPETKKSVTAILLISFAILLILGSLKEAGPAGNLLFGILEKLFGLGYYLLPFMSLLIAILFLSTREKKFFSITFLGAGLFILFGLGLIDLIFPDKGGWIGAFIGLLEVPFGKTAAIVMVSTISLISLLVTFNASLIMQPKDDTPGKVRDKGEDDFLVTGDASDEEDTPQKKTKKQNDREKAFEEEDEEPIVTEATHQATSRKKTAVTFANYVPPPLSLLHSTSEKPTSGDLRANANIIKRTLEGFGIAVEMSEINIGPKVTRYTLKPAEGVKLARITSLSPDLSLALAAHPIRIEAPIPGKSLVGIEVPNKSAALVRLGSLMGYDDFSKSSPLVFPLGRDVTGEPLFVDVEKMPHLLVAGSTGSGKSIMIHSILLSLIYKNSPETLKLILIDPKRVELSIYEGIPHLVAPVITESKKSIAVFRWAVAEMERRYALLLTVGARDIGSYNKKKHDEKLPLLVIVVDEMADLMASYGRDVEGLIVRLAQMARATGIHLLLSTQRPSVEVITGLIKANITARIALQVASQIDSRTILDIGGAEKLLGGGDLLFISSDYSKPKRIQASYISEEEIQKVTDFIRENNTGTVEEDDSIEESINEMTPDGRENGKNIVFDDYMEATEEEDVLLDDAVTIVKEAGKASASLLQRRLKVGYARAARLLDIMEAKGLIGPGDGAKPREIYFDEDEESPL